MESNPVLLIFSPLSGAVRSHWELHEDIQAKGGNQKPRVSETEFVRKPFSEEMAKEVKL